MLEKTWNIREGWTTLSVDTIPVAISEWLQDFDECLRTCKTTQDISKKINDLLLFQKLHQDILGVPGKPHAEQSENVLKNLAYWDFSNRLRLFEMRKEVLEKWFERYTSFSVGWSIGAGYLGYLHGMQESEKLPQVIFGASAWSLFPALYLLWQQALKANPEETKPEFNGLLSYLPKWMEDKTMWSNGEELITAFQGSCQTLIDLINKKRPEDQKLPSADKLKISDISKTFGIIASRKNEGNGKFQEVIFSGDDPLVQSVIASSNPEISILGMKFSVITDKKNKFLGNTWHDGDHTNYNPIEYGETLGLKFRSQVTPFSGLRKSASTINAFDDGVVRAVIVNEWDNFLWNEFRVPKTASDLQFDIKSLNNYLRSYKQDWAKPEHNTKTDYEVMEQNDGWSSATMEYRAKISHIQSLFYAIENGRNFYSGFHTLISAFEKAQLSPTDRDSIVHQITLFAETIQKEFDIDSWYIEDRIFRGYDLVHSINQSTLLSAKQKKDLVTSIFYRDNILIEPRLTSKLLPLSIGQLSTEQKANVENMWDQYTAEKMEYIQRTKKLPVEYLVMIVQEMVASPQTINTGRDNFLQEYHTAAKYAWDDFFEVPVTRLSGNAAHWMQLVGHEPRFKKQAIQVAKEIIEIEAFWMLGDQWFVEPYLQFIEKIPDPKIQQELRDIYNKARLKEIGIVQERLRFLAWLPEAKVPNK